MPLPRCGVGMFRPLRHKLGARHPDQIVDPEVPKLDRTLVAARGKPITLTGKGDASDVALGDTHVYWRADRAGRRDAPNANGIVAARRLFARPTAFV